MRLDNISNGDLMNEIQNTGPTAGGGGLGWMPVAVTFIIISAALGGILIVGELNQTNLDSIEITATITLDYGNGTRVTENITTTNYTAFGFLEAMVGFDDIDATYYPSFDSWLINSVNGVDIVECQVFCVYLYFFDSHYFLSSAILALELDSSQAKL